MTPQNYLNELKQQLDALYHTVEQLQSGLTSNPSQTAIDKHGSPPSLGSIHSLSDREAPLMHKDILVDELDDALTLEGHPIDESQMSPELQIKRLTAQLTVAYKRIAQLEEQLLSHQSVHNGSEYIYS